MYYLSFHIYTIYTPCLHVQYIHTHTHIYRNVGLHHNNYSFKPEMNYICFPEAFKSLNVLDIFY